MVLIILGTSKFNRKKKSIDSNDNFFFEEDDPYNLFNGKERKLMTLCVDNAGASLKSCVCSRVFTGIKDSKEKLKIPREKSIMIVEPI